MITKPCILLVDDDIANCLLYKEILEEAGYTVIALHDGAQAKDFCAMAHPDIDLVILDVEMPYLDGAQCLSEIRALNPELACLAVTAHIDHPQLDTMISHGISGILRKPFENTELIKWARKVLPTAQIKEEVDSDWHWA